MPDDVNNSNVSLVLIDWTREKVVLQNPGIKKLC